MWIHYTRSFLTAASGEANLHTPAVGLGEQKNAKKKAKAHKSTKLQIKDFIAANAPNKKVTIPLFFDQAQLDKIGSIRGERMLDIVSPGLFGGPGTVARLPESFVREVVIKQKELKWENLAKGSLYLNFFVMVMQGRAMWQAFEEVSQKGGLDQRDAIASMLAGTVGVAGAMAEMSSIMLTPVSAAGTPHAAELVSNIPKHLRLQYAAGLCMAAGALFDGAVSFARAQNKENQGDEDAAKLFRGAGAAQIVGGLSLGFGSYYAYRAALLNRVGANLLVQVLGASMSPLMLARCLTGIGLVLWLGGLTISFVAMYLEDDSNELHLRRSIFGTGHPQLGRYETIFDEMQSFEALSLGSSASLEWNDELGADEVTAIVKLFKPSAENAVVISLEGFDRINGKKIGSLYSGEMPVLQPETKEPDEVIYKTSKVFKTPDEVEAVRLTYWIYKNRKIPVAPIARGEIWIED